MTSEWRAGRSIAYQSQQGIGQQAMAVHDNVVECKAWRRIIWSMTDVIRVFVGSDIRMQEHGAELVLEHTIRKHASLPVDITWMRAVKGDPDWGECWERGREMYRPYTGQHATDFTTFRFAVPELCKFEGRAIYLDSDMLVRADIAELWNIQTKVGYACCGPRTDVAVIRCEKFRFPEWPSIEAMKRSGWRIGTYTHLLSKYQQFDLGALPSSWDCLDGKGFHETKTKLIHYTSMATQPWRPWPESFAYKPHPCKVVADEWFAAFKEATADVD